MLTEHKERFEAQKGREAAARNAWMGPEKVATHAALNPFDTVAIKHVLRGLAAFKVNNQ